MATSKSVIRSRVLFDYTKPDLHGYLYKQGALHKAFKKRYFVLYPGYLVYYTDEAKYRSDVAKGSLQGRLHAVRIRGGECHHAKESKDAPRGCKFGFTVSAPDPINKRSTYLLNASSREERQQWMAAVKRCQVNVSPKSSTKQDRKEIVSNGRTSETSNKSETTAPTTTREAPSKSPDQAADSDSSGEGSIFSATMSSPTPTKYPNAGRRETGVAAALIPTNYNDDGDDEATCTSFNGPYADSDDDIGPEPEMQAENPTSLQDDVVFKIGNGHVLMNGREPSPADHVNRRVTPSPTNDITSRPTVTASEVTSDLRGDEQLNDGASLAKTTSPEVITVSITKAVASDNLQNEAPGLNSSSEDTDDNPLPVGGHEHNPSDSGTTTSDDDDDEIVNPPEEKVEEQATPGIKVINPSLPRKPPLHASSSSPSLPKVEGNASPAPVRRTSTPFLQKTGYLNKRGGRRQNWKERFFVLTPGMFTYYKNDVQRTKPVGEVKLKNSSVHIPRPGEHKDLDHQFTVHTESQWNKRSNYVLAANTEQEMIVWIEAFKAAGQKVIMDIPPVSQAASNTAR